MKELLAPFYTRVAVLRRGVNTDKELAKKLSVSDPTISRWLHRAVTPSLEQYVAVMGDVPYADARTSQVEGPSLAHETETGILVHDALDSGLAAQLAAAREVLLSGDADCAPALAQNIRAFHGIVLERQRKRKRAITKQKDAA